MKFEQNAVSKRFVEEFNSLKEKKVFISQQEAAERLDFSPNSLSEILKGKRDVTIELLRKFFITFQVNPSLLFDSGIDSEIEKGRKKKMEKLYQRIVDIYVINKALGFNANFNELDPIAKTLANVRGINEEGYLKETKESGPNFNNELDININVFEDFFFKKFKELFYNVSVEYPKTEKKPLKKKK